MTTPDVRNRILHEATRLFGDKGYGSTSIRDVARAAGVTNPALYYHFGSKEALYLETIQAQIEAVYDGLTDILTREGSVLERLRAYLQGNIDFVRNNPSAARLLAFANHAPLGGEPHVDLMSQHMRSSELLLALVREGIDRGELRADVDPEDALMLITGQAVIAGFACLGGFPIPDDLADRMLCSLLAGLGPRPTSGP